MRHANVKTIVEEDLELQGRDQNELDLFLPLDVVLERRLTKLSFFSSPFTSEKGLPPDSRTYLGYCVISRETARAVKAGAKSLAGRLDRCYVREAVMRRPTTDDYYLCCNRLFDGSVGGKRYTVRGAYFAQQPGHVGCCAHAAITTISRILGRPIDDLEYDDINQHLSIPIPRDLAEDRGLSVPEIGRALREIGLGSVHFAFDPETAESDYVVPLTYQQVIYHAVESGFPVILAFNVTEHEGHVLSVVGHVFDKDTWLPEAERDYFELNVADGDEDTIRYLRSSAWASDFLVMDDNYGPYYSLPGQALLPAQALSDRVLDVIVALPPGLQFAAPFAEPAAALALYLKYLPIIEEESGFPFCPWGERLWHHVKKTRVILRTVLAERADYVQQLKDCRYTTESDEGDIELLERNLPGQFWLVEASIPELFSTNKARLADIVVDPSRSEDLTDWIAAIRFPGLFTVVDENGDLKHRRNALKHYYPSYVRRH